MRCAFAANGLRNLFDFIGGFVDANEKSRLDVGTDVVFANKPFGSFSNDLETLEGQVHFFIAMDNWPNQSSAVDDNLESTHSCFYDGLVGADLDIELAGDDRQ